MLHHYRRLFFDHKIGLRVVYSIGNHIWSMKHVMFHIFQGIVRSRCQRLLGCSLI